MSDLWLDDIISMDDAARLIVSLGIAANTEEAMGILRDMIEEGEVDALLNGDAVKPTDIIWPGDVN